VPLSESEAYAYTDGVSTRSRGPGGHGTGHDVDGQTEEISGGEQDTTNLRMELTAARLALETIDKGHMVTVYSDSSYLVICIRKGWYKNSRENGWLTRRKEPVGRSALLGAPAVSLTSTARAAASASSGSDLPLRLRRRRLGLSTSATATPTDAR
jgi:ribonuclease HI